MHIDEVAAIVDITGAQFERGGHIMYSHNHTRSEANLYKYVYQQKLSWQDAVARVKNEFTQPVIYHHRRRRSWSDEWDSDYDSDYDGYHHYRRRRHWWD